MFKNGYVDRAIYGKIPMTESKEFTDGQEVANAEGLNSSDVKHSELDSGTVFAGRYRILNLIGSGGMGSVYKALDLTLNRYVALKMLHRELVPDEHALLRFQNEARATSRIKNPGVVAVYDFGLADDQRPFLIMDYVEGVSLAMLIASSHKLDPERCASIFSKVADTLAHTHSKGVFHRDLKPSNILVTRDAQDKESIRVVDFGIAKVLEEKQSQDQQSITQTGGLTGSPLYMSPEQCNGLRVDERSDIYSLGCVMFEALSGEPPFHGATAYDTILAQISEAPPKLQMKPDNSGIARLMEQIVLKALAKTPEQRFQSMGELRDELNSVINPFSRAVKGANFRIAAVLASLILLVCGAVFLARLHDSISKPLSAEPLHIWQSSIGAPVILIPPKYIDVETYVWGCLWAHRHSEGDRSPLVAQDYLRLANLHRQYGFYGEAAKDYENALDIIYRLPNESVLPVKSATERLIAECYFLQKRYDQALIWYQKAIQSGLRLFDEDAPYFVQIYANLGDIYYSRGNLTEALDCLEKAVHKSKKSPSRELSGASLIAAIGKAPSVDQPVLLMSMADVLYGKQRYKEAISYYEKVLEFWTERLKSEAGKTTLPNAQSQTLSGGKITVGQSQILPGVGKALCEYNIGLAYEQLGDRVSARWYLKAGWNDLIKYLPTKDPLLWQAVSGYSEFLIKRDFPIGYFEAHALKQQVKKGPN